MKLINITRISQTARSSYFPHKNALANLNGRYISISASSGLGGLRGLLGDLCVFPRSQIPNQAYSLLLGSSNLRHSLYLKSREQWGQVLPQKTLPTQS